jgi:hypothetical protein
MAGRIIKNDRKDHQEWQEVSAGMIGWFSRRVRKGQQE